MLFTMFRCVARWLSGSCLWDLFRKLKTNILTNDRLVFWGCQHAVSERRKPFNGLCSFKLCKKLFLKNKQGKTRITTRLTIRGAKTGQSQRGPINDPHTICDTFSLCSMTFLHKSSVSSADAAVASRPHMPSREGLSGVRETLTPSNYSISMIAVITILYFSIALRWHCHCTIASL